MALSFDLPLPDEYKRISSPFGWRWLKVGDMTLPAWQLHRGQDHPAPIGVPGRCAYKGYVSRIWNGYRSGRCLELTHPTCSVKGFTVQTVYYHLNAVYFKISQYVTEREILFEVGNSGSWTTGPHLHFGIKVGGRWVDPRIALKIFKSEESEKNDFK
jgi:murein DD-endopeptidase MepM/ murein hydrolase activator NlpD